MAVTTPNDIAEARNKNAGVLILSLGCGHIKTYACLTTALQAVQNPSAWALKDARFTFSESGAQLYSKELDALVQTVASMSSSLERVMFGAIDRDFDSRPEAFWPSKSISDFLGKTRNHLKKIEFVSSGIVCTNDAELQLFYKVYIGTDREYLRCVYDFTTLFSKIPAVRDVSIRLSESKPGGEKRANDFRHFFGNQVIQSLKISAISPSDQHAMIDIAEGLLSPTHNLRELELNFFWYTGYGLEEDPTGPHWSSWQKLAEAVAANCTLEVVKIVFDSSEFEDEVPVTELDEFMLLLAHKLSANASSKIERLEVGPCPRHFEGEASPRELVQAFVHMLETNSSLKALNIDLESLAMYMDEMDYYRLEDELEMYLKQNKHGRKRLKANPKATTLEE